MIRGASACLAVATMLVACAGSSPGPSTTAGSATFDPSPNASASTIGSADAETDAPSPSAALPSVEATLPPCDADVICEGTMVAGTYSTHSLDVTVAFDLTGDGWVGSVDEPLVGFRLSNREIVGRHAIAVTAWNAQWNVDPCTFGTQLIDDSVDAFVARLSGTPGISAHEPAALTVADWPATRVDVTVTSQCPGAGPISLWTAEGGNPYTLGDGSQARVVVFRVELPRSIGLVPLVKFLVVVIEADPEVDFDLLLQKADQVLTTLTVAL